MILRLTFLGISILLCLCVNGQSIMIGERQYKSTEDMSLQYSNGYSNFDLNIKVAKNEKKGFIWLETENYDNAPFKGKIFIYLENGKIITCMDRNIKDSYNGKVISVYKLTELELKELSKSKIVSIRFTMANDWNKHTFVAENLRDNLGLFRQKIIIKTDSLINLLLINN